ncbi:type II secretion system F family protein [Nocardioides sediminis]|uniref:type II secretion system F family protein n=1 Tax=Nocardioides sediminis TaxID=433648 RepID=UPI001F21DEC8|nr:type II secretion system F family protein [Nocardioides sediminis]
MTTPEQLALVVAAAATALAVLLALPPPSRWADGSPVPDGDGSVRARPPWWPALLSGLAGCGAAVVLGGPLGLLVGAGAAGAAWVTLGRSETAAARGARAEAVRDLPHLVDLLAATLRSGAAPAAGLAVVCAACPGAAADRLEPVLARLRVGLPAAEVWRVLATDEVLAPLGHTLARAEVSGSSVAEAVERLADDLEREALATVEDRARAVGVRAAVPLGLCLLPAFILIGIVPTVAGLLATLRPGS